MQFAQYRLDPLPVVLAATLLLLAVAALVQRGWPSGRALAGQARLQRWAAAPWAPWLVWLLSTLYFLVTAWQAGRSLDIPWTDESMHLVQAQLLSRGMLSAPAHPLADHMESFFLFVKPRYAAMYFPGTSLLYVPFLWLGLPGWCFSIAVSGGLVALSFVVARRLMGPGGGLLAALALLSCDQLRFLSIRLVSHHTSALLNLGILYAYLRWREATGTGRPGWALSLGTLLGVSLLTRPVEALACSLALLLVMASCRLVHPRGLARDLLLLAAAASPWLAIQVGLNLEVTGNWNELPVQAYLQKYHFGAAYGSSPLPESYRPVPSPLPQKTDYFYGLIGPYLRHYQATDPWWETLSQRLPWTLIRLCAHPLWWIVWGIGLSTVRQDLKVWILGFHLAFFALLVPQSHYLPHYGIASAPALALLWARGVLAMAEHFVKYRRALLTFWLGTCLVNWPQLNPAVEEGHQGGLHRGTTSRWIRHTLAPQLRQPAVLLVRYRRWDQAFDSRLDDFHDEPVYTTDTLWPEDSRLALLHSLGAEKDMEVVRYFAARQPQRQFFLLDRRKQRLLPLGTAGELLERGLPFEDESSTVRSSSLP